MLCCAQSARLYIWRGALCRDSVLRRFEVVILLYLSIAIRSPCSFIDKNRDTMPDELSSVMLASKEVFIRELFESYSGDAVSTPAEGRKSISFNPIMSVPHALHHSTCTHLSTPTVQAKRCRFRRRPLATDLRLNFCPSNMMLPYYQLYIVLTSIAVRG